MRYLINYLIVNIGLLFLFINVNHVNALAQNVRVTHIANCGVLVEYNSKSVLFDAIFDPHLERFQSPTQDVIDKMINKKNPFEKLDLICVSHYHLDHFNAEYMLKVLEAHPEAKLVSCQQVIDSIYSTFQQKEIKKEQFITITPDKYNFIDAVINDFKVRAIRLKHSPYPIFNAELNKYVNKHKHVENIGFLVEIDDCVVFHSGDANSQSKKEFALFKLNEQNIDIAFLGRMFFYGTKGPGIDIMQNDIAAKHIFVNHFKLENLEIFQSVANETVDIFPNVYFLKEPLESIEISIKP